MKQWYQPEWDLDRGGRELVELFERVGFTEDQFRGRETNRLDQLNHLIHAGQLDAELRWL